MGQKGKSKGKGKGKRMSAEDRIRSISRTLSWITRHAEDYQRDEEGWIPISDIEKDPQLAKLGCDERDIREAVRMDEKGRFEVDDWRVRAVSSWSDDKVKKGLTEVPWSEVPSMLYHGTKNENLANILLVGLAPGRKVIGEYGGRMHLHFTSDRAQVRKGSELIVEINKKALQQVLKEPMQTSANGWYFTEEIVPVTAFGRVTTLDNKTVVHSAVVKEKKQKTRKKERKESPQRKAERKRRRRARSSSEEESRGAAKKRKEQPEREDSVESERLAEPSSSSRLPAKSSSASSRLPELAATKRQRKEAERASGEGSRLSEAIIAEHESAYGMQWKKEDAEGVLADLGRSLAEDSWQKFLAKQYFRDYLLKNGQEELVRQMGFEACSSCVVRGTKTTESAAAYARDRIIARRQHLERGSESEGEYSPPREEVLLEQARQELAVGEDVEEQVDYDPSDAEETVPVPAEELPAEAQEETEKASVPGSSRPPEPLIPPSRPAAAAGLQPTSKARAQSLPPWRVAREARSPDGRRALTYAHKITEEYEPRVRDDAHVTLQAIVEQAKEIDEAARNTVTRSRSAPVLPSTRFRETRSPERTTKSKAPSPRRQKKRLVLTEARSSRSQGSNLAVTEPDSDIDEEESVRLKSREDRILECGAEDAVTGMVFHVVHELQIHRAVVEISEEYLNAARDYTRDVFFTTRCIAWQGGDIASAKVGPEFKKSTHALMDSEQLDFAQRYAFEKYIELIAQKLVLRARAEARGSVSSLLSRGWIEAVQQYNEKRLELDYALFDFLKENGIESRLTEEQLLKLQLLRTHYENHREKLAAVGITLKAAEKELTRQAEKLTKFREQVSEALSASGGWECDRCGETNLISRRRCYRCCGVPNEEVLRRVREAIEKGEGLRKFRTRKRGGWKVRLQEEAKAQLPEKGKGKKGKGKQPRGQKRKYDAEDSEQNHPYAHYGAWTVPTVATLGSVYVLLNQRTQYVADQVVYAVTDTVCQVVTVPSRLALSLEVTVSRALRSVGNFLDAMLEEANLFISTVTRAVSCFVVAVLVVVVVVSVVVGVFKGYAHYADPNLWSLSSLFSTSPKERLKKCGFNPEGNMNTDAILLEWPTLTRDHIAMKTLDRFDKAVLLVDNVQHIGSAEFLVKSESSLRKYKVQLNYGPEDVVGYNCQCADYLKRGVPCKHIGGALLWVRRAQNAAKQLAVLEAEKKSPAPSSEEELVEDVPKAVRKARPLLAISNLPGATVAAKSVEPSCWDVLRIKARVIQESSAGSSNDPPLPKVGQLQDSAKESLSREDEKVEKALEEVRKELQSLRLEVGGRVLETPPPVAQNTVGNGISWSLLPSAEEMHMTTIKKIQSTKKDGSVILLGYSFDRRDVVEALLGAHRQGTEVRVLLDHRQTLKGPKEQFAVVKEAVANGLDVRLLCGRSISAEYKKAGRGNNFGGLLGIMHCKLVLVREDRRGEAWLATGSANWSTSSRANFELCVSLSLNNTDASLLQLDAVLNEMWSESRLFTEEDTKAAQRARSQSPTRDNPS